MEALEQHRGYLWRLCYRLTGSVAEVEDLVQQTFVRALECPPPDLERDLRPWLTRVAANLGKDALRRRRAAPYVGAWLPELVEEIPSAEPNPGARYEQLESLSVAFMVALEVL